ncbi:MAG TPA: hypothetical protein VGW34_09505 [Allosphingosinicella sp.]|nr:hypothetical protein [Allosphingosinicella sp.]
MSYADDRSAEVAAMSEADRQALAVAAAATAAGAVAELLRYGREGPVQPHQPFDCDVEPIEQLLDAAKMVIEIEGNLCIRRDIYEAIAAEIEGWVP